MTVEVVDAPAAEPVSLAEARQWCRLEDDATEHDGVLTLLIASMRAYAENLTGRAFVRRRLKLYASCWPWLRNSHYNGLGIELPYPPLIQVESVKYIDTDGTLQTLDTSLYDVHAWREPGVVVKAWGEIWPATRSVPDAVQVTYLAGYAPTSSPDDEAALRENVPSNVKVWMHARLATLFENREQLIVGTAVNELPRAFVDGLLDDLIVGARIGG